MAEKNLKTRIQLKNDTEANWQQAVNFAPKKGELIIYNTDSDHEFPRFKVGNGSTKVSDLPFTNDIEITGTLGTGTQIGILNINGESTTIYTPNSAPSTIQVTQSANTPTAEFIVGTNTESSDALTGVLGSTTELTNGKIIYYMTKYKLPAANVTLELNYADSGTTTGAIPIYNYGNVRCTTPYPAAYMLTLIYYEGAFYIASSNLAIIAK